MALTSTKDSNITLTTCIWLKWPYPTLSIAIISSNHAIIIGAIRKLYNEWTTISVIITVVNYNDILGHSMDREYGRMDKYTTCISNSIRAIWGKSH